MSIAFSKLFAAMTVQFVLVSGLVRAEKVHVPVSLEGYVRDDSGKPVKGALIMVSQGSYTTTGSTGVIPIYVPKTVVGAVVVDDPDTINVHDINTHFTETDGKGHYSVGRLSPGQYRFAVQAKTKRGGDFKTHTNNLVDNKKLLAKYKFPPAETIVVAGGQTTVKNLILPPSKLIAVCSVPKPAESEDAKFINGFAAKAAHGDAEAMLLMGYAYQQGQHGVAPDNSQAACWFRRVAVKNAHYKVKTEKAIAEARRALRELNEAIY